MKVRSFRDSTAPCDIPDSRFPPTKGQRPSCKHGIKPEDSHRFVLHVLISYSTPSRHDRHDTECKLSNITCETV